MLLQKAQKETRVLRELRQARVRVQFDGPKDVAAEVVGPLLERKNRDGVDLSQANRMC
jgi:hypothetical protein